MEQLLKGVAIAAVPFTAAPVLAQTPMTPKRPAHDSHAAQHDGYSDTGANDPTTHHLFPRRQS
jgi:hypothetical protein